MKTRGNGLLKKIDYYVGCPLVWILGMFRVKNALPMYSESPRIVIVKTAGIGDTIISSLIIQEIKYKYPKAHITYICSANAGAVKLLDNIDEIVIFNMKNPVKGLNSVSKLQRFDLLIDLAPWPRLNAIISYFVKAKFKVGFKRKSMYRHYVYDAYIEHSDELHEADNYRKLLDITGIKNTGILPRLSYIKEKFMSENIAIFHMFPAGSSTQQRMWPMEKWVELAKQVYEEYGLKICFTGGKEDIEVAEDVVNKVHALNVDIISMAGKCSLNETKELLSRSKLLVSVNTGVMHMGAAVNIPLVALHGATNELRWGPVSDNAIVIKSGEVCQPCISLGFETKCDNPVCMKNITVDMAMNGVKKVLER